MSKRYRYYCPQRPPMPGAVPGKGIVEVKYNDDRSMMEGCQRPAWGWVEYDHELTAKEVRDYELIPAEDLNGRDD